MTLKGGTEDGDSWENSSASGKNRRGSLGYDFMRGARNSKGTLQVLEVLWTVS